MVKHENKITIALVTILVFLIIAWIYIAVSFAQLRELNKDTLQMMCEVNSKIAQFNIENSLGSNSDPCEAYAVSTYLGEFTITHYCACEKCCGKTDGITASGTIATPQRTVAVDPSVIPLGTMLNINGQLYMAEDKGGAIKGNRIDIYVESHEEARQLGKYKTEVFSVEME